MNNVNPETGIRYGVIAINSLDPDLAQELMYGPGAVDMTYDDAYAEAKKEAGARFVQETEEAGIAASETDHNMTDSEREIFIERYLDEKLDGVIDRDEFIENALEQFSDTYSMQEPRIVGIYGKPPQDQINYLVTWVGGSPLLMVLLGPQGACRSLCSPCIPNAGDLDSGYFVDGETGFECYVVPRDWLATGEVQEAA
jgi:hypothetical protein